jgi:hypothetical protein
VYYEDARASLLKGEVIKSQERREIEDNLVAAGTATRKQFEQFNKNLTKVIQRKPIMLPNGENFVYTEQALSALIEEYKTIQKRLNKLLQNPIK